MARIKGKLTLEEEFFPASLDKQRFDFDEINEKWFVPTCSFVFRNFLKDNENHPIFSTPLFFSDRPLMAFAAKEGDFLFIDEVMGCFRRHETNMTKIGNIALMYFEGAMAYKKLMSFFPENSSKLSEQVVKWLLWASDYSFKNKKFVDFFKYASMAAINLRTIYAVKTYGRYLQTILKGKQNT